MTINAMYFYNRYFRFDSKYKISFNYKLSKNKLQIFLEFCQLGSLDNIMKELERPLQEEEIKPITKQLCQALIYLHERHFIHRDVKAANVLLSASASIKLG